MISAISEALPLTAAPSLSLPLPVFRVASASAVRLPSRIRGCPPSLRGLVLAATPALAVQQRQAEAAGPVALVGTGHHADGTGLEGGQGVDHTVQRQCPVAFQAAQVQRDDVIGKEIGG
jgi:hypothetical protein